MSGNAVSEDDVFRIADEIEATGRKASNEAIRDALGRGSYTTISKFLRAWRSTKVSSEGAVEPLPEQVAGRCQLLGQDLWRTALEVATGRFGEERSELRKAHAEAEAAADDLAATLDALTRQRDELKVRLTAADEAIEGQAKALEQASTYAAEFRVRAEAAEAEAQRLEAHVADLRGEVKRLAKQNTELVGALSRLSSVGSEKAPE